MRRVIVSLKPSCFLLETMLNSGFHPSQVIKRVPRDIPIPGVPHHSNNRKRCGTRRQHGAWVVVSDLPSIRNALQQGIIDGLPGRLVQMNKRKLGCANHPASLSGARALGDWRNNLTNRKRHRLARQLDAVILNMARQPPSPGGTLPSRKGSLTQPL